MAGENSKVYRPQGGASLELASGGAINIASGGGLNLASGATLALAAGSTLSVGGQTVGAVIRVADVTLTAAQILALNATPITIVAAPGAGFMNIPIGFLCFFNHVTTEFSGVAAGEDLAFKYTDGSGTQICAVETTSWLNVAADSYRYLTPQFAATGTPGGFAPVANAAIVAQLLTGEFAAGDGTIRVIVPYITLSVA